LIDRRSEHHSSRKPRYTEDQPTHAKENIMKALKLIAATTIFAAAFSAFAGTDDGSVGPFWQAQSSIGTQIHVAQAPAPVTQAPAPAPEAAAYNAGKDDARKAAQHDFMRQQRENSDGSQNKTQDTN
jgi:hypothetical protein